MKGSHLSYTERATYCLSPLAKRLFELLDEKETNLALSADVTSGKELLDLADTLGKEICLLKTHIDMIADYTPEVTKQLRKLAQKHHFLLFEDRKFGDIGNIVKQQYAGGIYRIADWADLVTVHSLPGPFVVQGITEVGRKKNRGVLLVAELSSANNLMDQAYIDKTLLMAEKFADSVIGFITQRVISSDPHWINCTPGVKLAVGTDKLGQQYVTPKQAIADNGTDIIIVGRGIISAADPVAEAERYREEGWKAYIDRRE